MPKKGDVHVMPGDKGWRVEVGDGSSPLDAQDPVGGCKGGPQHRPEQQVRIAHPRSKRPSARSQHFRPRSASDEGLTTAYSSDRRRAQARRRSAGYGSDPLLRLARSPGSSGKTFLQRGDVLSDAGRVMSASAARAASAHMSGQVTSAARAGITATGGTACSTLRVWQRRRGLTSMPASSTRSRSIQPSTDFRDELRSSDG